MTTNFSVSWNEYQKNICKGLGGLQQRGEFVDMTLAADGHHVKVHQMVLSLVSPFIKELIKSANCQHPVIFLNRVSYQTMQAILEYAYSGEVVVGHDRIGDFLQACKDLHIRGLEDMLKHELIQDNIDTTHSNSRKRKSHSREETHKNSAKVTRDDDMLYKSEEEQEIESIDVIANVQDENVLSNKKRDERNELVNHSVLKEPGSMQYSVSVYGNLQMLLNRYVYSFIRTRKNNERYWRCVNQQKSGCLAHVITVDDRIHERVSPHNHSFHDAQIMKRIKNNNVYTSYKQVEAAAAIKKKNLEEADLLKKSFNDL